MPCATGAWHLHELTQDDPISCFILTSSMSAVLGGVGQTGYSAGNAFLDALARMRRAAGLPATSVNLDPISDTGYMTRDARVADYLRNLGFAGIPSAEACASIGLAIASGRPETIITALDWKSWKPLAGHLGRLPLFSELRDATAVEGAVGDGARERIAAAPAGERQGVAEDHLRTEIAKILRRSEAQIESEAPLEDLGLDSLNMVELVLRLEGDLGVTLPSGLMLGRPTLRTLAETVLERMTTGSDPAGAARGVDEASSRAAGQLASPETLASDADAANDLDYDVIPHLAPPLSPGRAVFVTGATGVVGTALVADLLETTSGGIVCLVRGASDAEAATRLRTALRRRAPHLDIEAASARLKVVAGDIAEPLFGLAPEVYDGLAEDIGDVFHLAAAIKHILPYSELRQANVGGGLEVLRFAMERRLKRVHFASSIAVFPPGATRADKTIHEADQPLHPERLDNAYTQTKWVAEALFRAAAARGLPSRVHRLGIIVNEDLPELIDPEALMWRILQASVAIGAIPDVKVSLFLTGSRFAARAMRQAAISAEEPEGPFHVVSDGGGTLRDLAVRLEARGVEIDVLAVGEWTRRLSDAGLANAGSALSPYIRMAEHEGDRERRMSEIVASMQRDQLERFDRRNLKAALGAAFVDDCDVNSYLDRAADRLAEEAKAIWNTQAAAS